MRLVARTAIVNVAKRLQSAHAAQAGWQKMVQDQHLHSFKGTASVTATSTPIIEESVNIEKSPSARTPQAAQASWQRMVKEPKRFMGKATVTATSRLDKTEGSQHIEEKILDFLEPWKARRQQVAKEHSRVAKEWQDLVRDANKLQMHDVDKEAKVTVKVRLHVVM
jgi:hypothetical protein